MAEASVENYFTSYADLGVHSLMLKDRHRTVAYRRFFEENRNFVKDKIVLDVGAGTGILSLFAATAGAKKVYAVEASDMATLCKEIVEENHLENIIEVIHSRVEEVSLPEKVDIIVSEWMGFYLLHESMLDSVILARDRFLSPFGVMVPSHANLYLAPVDLSDHFRDRAEEWGNVYGFDFSPIASYMNMEEVSKPLIKTIKPGMVIAEPQKVIELDLLRVTSDDIACISQVFCFSFKKECKIFGFAAWFDVRFHLNTNASSARLQSGTSLISLGTSMHGAEQQGTMTNESIVLGTGPWDPPTHWMQTTILLPGAALVDPEVELSCCLEMAQSPENKRQYDITIQLLGDGSGDVDDTAGDSISPDFEECTEHSIPCGCGSDRCKLISKLLETNKINERDMQDESDDIQQELQEETMHRLQSELENLNSSQSSASIADEFMPTSAINMGTNPPYYDEAILPTQCDECTPSPHCDDCI